MLLMCFHSFAEKKPFKNMNSKSLLLVFALIEISNICVTFSKIHTYMTHNHSFKREHRGSLFIVVCLHFIQLFVFAKNKNSRAFQKKKILLWICAAWGSWRGFKKSKTWKMWRNLKGSDLSSAIYLLSIFCSVKKLITAEKKGALSLVRASMPSKLLYAKTQTHAWNIRSVWKLG